MFSRPLPLLLAGCLGCAHAPLLPPSHPPVMTERVRPSPAHGRRPFPFPLRDGRTGQPLPEASLHTRLLAARVIYAGERHTDAASHDVQLAMLGRLYALDHSLAVGVEMLPRSAQPHLDDYIAGKIDEETLLEAVRWDDVWGYDFSFYRPIFGFCRAHKISIFALNSEQDLVRAVRRLGVEGLPAAQRALLPDGYPWPLPEPHRQYLREVFAHHPRTTEGPMADQGPRAESAEEGFHRFSEAQLVWDETMAESVARILASPSAPRRLLVLAGIGHIGRYAVPQRAARRGAGPSLTVMATDEPEGPPP
ncbi:MAG: ChaN family lipoprotein, partial [Myxococcota bacterium]|nr:ChaN family lipoprotein [Myxococcota bacterium]